MAEIEPIPERKRLKSVDEISGPIFRADWSAIKRPKSPTSIIIIAGLLIGAALGWASLQLT